MESGWKMKAMTSKEVVLKVKILSIKCCYHLVIALFSYRLRSVYFEHDMHNLNLSKSFVRDKLTMQFDNAMPIIISI